ncbi:macrolide ABC transporter ATP-binding protein [Candidatus Falkowbacteria bacterium RIFOXYB2_FULL_34_18]|uniref:Macrolide ABC transporter ATP-binding protein n=1 Tax=Candidatus Falkowbacteria bacterium RIFOXYD2_FULL_34_120 TaxID=1798007 RepID=A0A1F5TPR0_9BACT|nr:MAG: macrolide ABC transporter ATP-binding protein [Candidatus Falkowbacteria bacterium RIFOXYB2_FULL_34_18]OGF29339.1 MAG: macrolide ABC transporter ATP-binding protein [Candidatus Falkowbacteria bacterium RIFOXYC12_FULL_34_55]OGF36455.1 MAG: macrolide ABC transporter ATP-binding protein [Candidatus Falkowbacteria bacterium RIFOXYC2_FULL_34_220]OGF38934.1 MAG: macrolide ABC transporter ATP-binding protein [Candidatus Falkowbacteria bacterium RIFOXYD12_FULL_34_57]OGF40953.1 MAG: macrolide AB
MINVQNLKKEFITGEVVTKVLQGVSFSLNKGEFIAIMGPSGSGKSTLMHILGLLDRATFGKYEFEGVDVTTLGDDELALMRNEKIGFVFQSFNLLSRTNVLDNVKLPLTYSVKKINIEKRAREVLASVGLEHRLNYYTNQISGGEKQRVAIARALVNNPSVIFADEPTGNLDSKSGIQVMEILQRLNKEGNTIILVTHETYTAEHAERIIHVKDGLIVDDQRVSHRRWAKDGEILK